MIDWRKGYSCIWNVYPGVVDEANQKLNWKYALAKCDHVSIPAHFPPFVKAMFRHCWMQDADNRPAFDELFDLMASEEIDARANSGRG
jgi:hypothetical protein